MQIKDVMEPITTNWLTPDLTLYEAICTMRRIRWGKENASINGMVVMEHGIKLVGVLSIKDVIRAVIPSYLDNLGGFTWEGMLESQALKVKDILIGDIMSTDPVTVLPNSTLMYCADLMIDKKLQRLPVVDENHKVLGMVHIRDLYLTVTDLLCDIKE